jgi:hypothetical protein
MDPLGEPVTTRPIQTSSNIWIQPCPNWHFGCIDNPNRQFGNGSVLTRSRTRSDGPAQLLILLANQSQTLNRCWVVKWLSVVQLPILEFNKCTVNQDILIISKYQSTNSVSSVLVNLSGKSLSKVGIPKSSDASLSEVNLRLLHTLQTCISLKWYACCDAGQIKGSSWMVWRGNR